MNVLVVACHPLPASFTAAIAQRVIATATSSGHAVRVHDLYAEAFDPRLSASERLGAPSLDPLVCRAADDLAWARAVVLVYPTWWSAQPAMLTGWLQRTLAGSAGYRNVRRVVAVTTHGSSKLVNMVQGEGGKLILQRTVRGRFSRRCRTTWVALYGIDRATALDRARHLARAERVIRRL